LPGGEGPNPRDGEMLNAAETSLPGSMARTGYSAGSVWIGEWYRISSSRNSITPVES
jgi:hypothetical protein